MSASNIEYTIARASGEIQAEMRLWRWSNADEMKSVAQSIVTATGEFNRTADAAVEVVRSINRLAEITQKQTETLEQISLTLKSPRATAAAESRQRGVWAYNAGLLDDAERELLQALELDPMDYIAHLFMGHVYLNTNRDTQCRAAYEQARTYGPRLCSFRQTPTLHPPQSDTGLPWHISAKHEQQPTSAPTVTPTKRRNKQWTSNPNDQTPSTSYPAPRCLPDINRPPNHPARKPCSPTPPSFSPGCTQIQNDATPMSIVPAPESLLSATPTPCLNPPFRRQGTSRQP